MPLPGDLLQARRVGGVELDSIDDELFSTDYWSPTPARHLTLLPEPPTVRLAPPTPSPWLSVAYYPASEYSADENGTEIVLLVGIAVLLVVAVASTGVVLFWFA